MILKTEFFFVFDINGGYLFDILTDLFEKLYQPMKSMENSSNPKYPLHITIKTIRDTTQLKTLIGEEEVNN